ncbi:zinc finger protein 862-like [Linepithema humile]|uniref:zinc finger protein 862-like n=1 Tax=Linepithema humile TaxID=83485 RepID=UPI00351F68DB
MMMSFQPINICTKEQRKEAQLSLYVAVHTSIASVDHHLSDLHKDTPFNISLHRTKCTNIINNVIGLYFYEALVKDIGDGYYSLLIDESTDITVNKMLGIAIRYYSVERKKIVSTFLRLIHIEDGTARSIVNAIKKLLIDAKLQLIKMQGIGTDNASTMVGVNSGVYAQLKKDVPHLILIRCVCHSLQLAISKATENTLPRNIEFLIKETYNWFANSSIRQLNYAQVYQTLNNGQEPLKILRVAETRWLSIEPAVKRILDQWTELKAHFEISRVNDNCYTAELLYSMYRDKKNFIYLSFLYPILSMVQKTNKNFESKVADPTKLLSDIKRLYSTVANKIVLSTARIDIYEQDIEKYLDPSPALGYAFDSSCTENEIVGQEKENLKSRCVSFLIALVKELKNRLPDNIKILERISAFSVTKCLKANKLPITDITLYYGKKDAITIAQIELEWENIHHVIDGKKHKTRKNFG